MKNLVKTMREFRRKGSEFTKKNPWKKWPPYIACFCGCGKKTRFCPAQKLMPQWITPKDYDIAFSDYTEKLKYVEGLASEGKTYRDADHSEQLFRIFLERDKTHENATYGKNGDERGVGGDTPLDHDDRERRNGLAAAKLSGKDTGSDNGGAT